MPVLAFCFDENAGSTTADNSGNGHTGTLVNNPTWVAGRYGSALRFDGNRSGYQYVSFGPNDTFDALTQGTIMAWVKPATATGVFHYWFQSGQNGQCNWPMQLGVTNNTFDFWGGASGCNASLNATSTIPTPVTDWHHLAYVVDSTGNRFYVDGQLATPTYSLGSAASTVFFAQTATGTSQYRVGSTDYAPETFDGIIDEFRIYAAPLAQADIQAAMNSGFCGP